MNETADFVSKLVDYDDWFVSHEFFKTLTHYGDPVRLIGFQTIKIPNYQDLIHFFGRQTVKRWMRSRKTGLMKIIGLFLPFFLFQQ